MYTHTMGYIQDCGRKLDDFLAARGASDETRAEVVTFVKHMILESYHNGLGKKINPPERHRRAGDEAEAERAHERRTSNRRPTRPRR